MEKIEIQQLDDELSFKLYTLNRLIQQTYTTYLTPLNITYPQYLVMKILMEKDEVPVNLISARLMLESNTVTPILQRMERQELVERTIRCSDQRQCIISLTAKGEAMRQDVAEISVKVTTALSEMDMNCTIAHMLKGILNEVIQKIS
jgi:DNA-binding MarR family transcriptional regulator